MRVESKKKEKKKKKIIFITASFTSSLIGAMYIHQAEEGIAPLHLSPVQFPANTPDFLQTTYDCWSSRNSLYDCVPFSKETGRLSLDDVNIIQAIKGTGIYTCTADILTCASFPNFPFNSI